MTGLDRFNKYADAEVPQEEMETQKAVTAYVRDTFLQSQSVSLEVVRDLFETVGATLPCEQDPCEQDAEDDEKKCIGFMCDD